MLRLVPRNPVRFPTPEEVKAMPLEQQRMWFDRILAASVGGIEHEAIECCDRCDARLQSGDVDYCQRCLAADYEQAMKLMAIEDGQARRVLKKRATAV